MYKPGQTVRIIHDSYPGEPGGRTFVGQTGTIRTVTPHGVTIAGLNGPAETYGFYNEEIEPA
jgi:hypothetical protein